MKKLFGRKINKKIISSPHPGSMYEWGDDMTPLGYLMGYTAFCRPSGSEFVQVPVCQYIILRALSTQQ